jgi:predicted N-acetyltransferase YhbS
MRVEKMKADWAAYEGPEERLPRSIFIRDGERVLAHAGVDVRTVGTSQGDVTVLALARVCTDPAERGRNLGAAVVRETFQLVDRGVFPWSLFQTTHKVRPFYEKLGACLVANRIVNSLGEDPTKNPFWDEIVMRYAAGPGWPEGEIDLRGPGY